MHPGRALALRAAGRLTRLAGRARAWRTRRRPPTVALDAVRRRLELLLAALYGESGIALAVEARPAPARGWLGRLTRRDDAAAAALPASEGTRVRLPATLPAGEGEGAALARFRLLAVGQAERIVRGTAAAAPGGADALVRDLYLLRESALADAAVARRAPGLRDALAAARAEALARRPDLARLSPAEREVEQLVRTALAASPERAAAALGGDGDASDDPEGSRRWAAEAAGRVRASGGPYRGVPPAPHWGEPPRVAGDLAHAPTDANPFVPPGVVRVQGTTAAAGRTTGDDATRGRSGRAAPEPPPETSPPGSASAPQGTGEAPREPAVRASEGGGAGSLSASSTAAAELAPDALALAFTAYPEWDADAGRYAREALVRHAPPDETAPGWADDALREHAVLVRQVRARFERLRPRRTRLPRVRDGEELDTEACVRALVERRAGFAPDDRLYVASRPARRPIAIAVLVDASGSTEAHVTERDRVIDVERVAVLLAATALDALGDRYAVLAFSGQGARDVRVRTLKDFGERNGEAVRRRVSALVPGGFTRLGAALRHATARLDRQGDGHRLLLVLSDGKPNDVDGYHADYAVEDARQAVHEAHAKGVIPFCLTVEAEEPEYLARIFGAPGYTILRHPEQLPVALLGVVRRLLSG